MISGWEEVSLADVITEARSGFACGADVDEGLLQVRMNNVTVDGRLDFTQQRRVPTDLDRSVFTLQPDDVLFNATNSPDLVGKTALFRGRDEPVVFSNHFLRLRTDRTRVIPSYLARWLQYQYGRGVFRGMAQQWVNQATVRKERLVASLMPLPPLDDQRRVVHVLDAAQRLAALRRRSMSSVDALEQISLALHINRGVSTVELQDILASPLGNGLSPASSGSHPGTVLTLSAFGDRTLKTAEQKSCLFAKPPADRQMVRRGTFLVSRGNGNLSLVGRGLVVREDLPGVAFPDTVIGAVIDPDQVSPEYLTAVWGTARVRQQIERAATTTNGTYKINQQRLAAVTLPLPPPDELADVTRALRALDRQRARLTEDRNALASLFASLQHRAFTGGL